MAQLLDLTGRVAVVTAGSGKNLGSATASRLAELGASVAVIGRRQAEVDATATHLRDRWKHKTMGVAADASSWDAIHKAVADIESGLGPIDIWVNNVGSSRGDGTFSDRTQANIDSVIASNLNSTVYATHAVIGGMLSRRRGTIINVASEGGKLARRGLGVFCTTKAAVIAFTSNLSREVGPAGIRVVAVCPGAMIGADRIEVLRTWGDKPFSGAAMGWGSDRWEASVRETISRTSLGRPSTADEVANVIAYLATDAASYVHGTAISVGGGMTA